MPVSRSSKNWTFGAYFAPSAFLHSDFQTLTPQRAELLHSANRESPRFLALFFAPLPGLLFAIGKQGAKPGDAPGSSRL
jgi:hypothetical protein